MNIWKAWLREHDRGLLSDINCFRTYLPFLHLATLFLLNTKDWIYKDLKSSIRCHDPPNGRSSRTTFKARGSQIEKIARLLTSSANMGYQQIRGLHLLILQSSLWDDLLHASNQYFMSGLLILVQNGILTGHVSWLNIGRRPAWPSRRQSSVLWWQLWWLIPFSRFPSFYMVNILWKTFSSIHLCILRIKSRKSFKTSWQCS